MQRFRNRRNAGRRLAGVVADLGLENPVVVGLPRGGVVVAAPVAAAFGAPLDVLVVRKLGVPGHAELGFGAIAEHDVRVLNPGIVDGLGITSEEIERVERAERAELRRRLDRYVGGRSRPALRAADVVVVDDGLATGYTALAALEAVRTQEPRRLVLAVPVAAPEAVRLVNGIADDVVALLKPRAMGAVGMWYDDFGQTGDDEVRALLGVG